MSFPLVQCYEGPITLWVGYQILAYPWRSLVEGEEFCIGHAVSCCACDKPKINYAAHAWQLSIHV